MSKTHDGKKESPTSHGGFRWQRPPELRRIRINVMLSPESIRLLEPFTRTGQRSQIIDAAIQEFLKKDVKVQS